MHESITDDDGSLMLLWPRDLLLLTKSPNGGVAEATDGRPRITIRFGYLKTDALTARGNTIQYNGNKRTTQAQQQDDNATMDLGYDNVHRYDNGEAFELGLERLLKAPKGKPGEDDQELDLKSTLTGCFLLCGQDKTKWKRLVLSLIYKRYHRMSPEAKALAKERHAASATGGDAIDKTALKGGGQRYILYDAATHMFEILLMSDDDAVDDQNSDGQDAKELDRTMVSTALGVLIELCPHAGGSRDICALIERFVGTISKAHLQSTRVNAESLFGKSPTSTLVARGVQFCATKLSRMASAALERVLTIAADMLDEDKAIISDHRNESLNEETNKTNKKTGADKGTTPPLPSTIHIFLPHRDRGKCRKPRRNGSPSMLVSGRQVVNSVAEILIWSHTTIGRSNPAFVSTYESLLRSNCFGRSMADSAKDTLHRLQTIIRRERKILNSYARDNGYMLTDLLALDSDAITFQKIRQGKQSDLAEMKRVAAKRGLKSVLALTKQYAEQKVATKLHLWSTVGNQDGLPRSRTNTRDPSASAGAGVARLGATTAARATSITAVAAAATETPTERKKHWHSLTVGEKNTEILSKMPVRFHAVTAIAFGGFNLAARCALTVAEEMIQNNIPISQLESGGYPIDVLNAVKAAIADIRT